MQSDSPRWNAQVRAALRLWLIVAESSSTHPSRLPECRDELAGFTPHTISEIEQYLADGVVPRPPEQFLTIPAAAAKYGVVEMTLRREVKRMGLRYVFGRAYDAEQLRQAVDRINARKADG